MKGRWRWLMVVIFCLVFFRRVMELTTQLAVWCLSQLEYLLFYTNSLVEIIYSESY